MKCFTCTIICLLANLLYCQQNHIATLPLKPDLSRQILELSVWHNLGWSHPSQDFFFLLFMFVFLCDREHPAFLPTLGCPIRVKSGSDYMVVPKVEKRNTLIMKYRGLVVSGSLLTIQLLYVKYSLENFETNSVSTRAAWIIGEWAKDT